MRGLEGSYYLLDEGNDLKIVFLEYRLETGNLPPAKKKKKQPSFGDLCGWQVFFLALHLKVAYDILWT